MKRREFLAASVSSMAGAAILGTGCRSPAPLARDDGHERRSSRFPFEFEGVSVAELQKRMGSGQLTSHQLATAYLRRISAVDQAGPELRAVIELNPEALSIASALDDERRTKGPRGPLHGIPVLIKDNLSTHDRMTTTAGSLALEGSIALRDSFVASRLRQAGAVILGKTNLSEWANFRGSRSISGWSGRGGQTRNPYCRVCNPSGSSSGSAAAVSASMCAVAVGTETNGSIVSPSSYCGIVGLKPTVGLVSRSGIIPISSSQDTAGPMGRCVADVAAMLGAMTGRDALDLATSQAEGVGDYSRYLEAQALRGARLGVRRSMFKVHRRLDPIFEASLTALRSAGAELVELESFPSRQGLGGADYKVMLYEFKAGLNAYFKEYSPSARVKNLADLIAFNQRMAERELPYFGQETLIEAEAMGPLTDDAYAEAKKQCRTWSTALTDLLKERRLDAVVAPTSGPADLLDYVHGDRGLTSSSTYAAVSGLPNITVPCGHLFGLPVGLSFFGPAWSEGRLLALAFSFEQATRARQSPRFLNRADELFA